MARSDGASSRHLWARMWPVVVAGATWNPANAVDLLQAYQAAQLQDPSLRASRAQADAVRERQPQAQAQLGPSLSATLARNRNDLNSTTPDLLGRPATTHSGYYSGNAVLTLRQPLYRPAAWSALQQAEHVVAEAEANLQKEARTAAVRVATAYFEVLLADDQLALILASKASFTAQLDAAKRALAAGSGIRTDIDEAQAKLDMARAQELEALQQQSFARRALDLLIGRSAGALSPLNLNSAYLEPITPSHLEDWVARAERGNPELLALRARREAVRLDVEKAQAGHKPSLDATAQLSRSVSENVLNVRSRYDNAALGVQLNVPIYAGGYVNSAVRQAQAELAAVEATWEATHNDVTLRVHREYRGVTEGVLRVRALEQAARSSAQVLVSSQKAFAAGSRTRLDILTAEQQLALAQRDLAQARYAYLLARVRLHAVAGAEPQTAIEEINQWLAREGN